MDQIFELHAINVVERVGRYDFHIGHEKGRVQLRIGNTSRYVTAGHADLVQQIAIGSDKRVVRSEEHTSELQSLMRISYAVFCLKKKKTEKTTLQTTLNTDQMT